MEPEFLPFELRKANIHNMLGNNIEKAERSEHKYIRKEGDRYIYENAKVKTPHGHGTVVSTQRHPIDINHIKSVKVKVGDQEYELTKEEVHPWVNEFDESDKKDLAQIMKLSREFKNQNALGISTDLSNIENVYYNVENMMHEDAKKRSYYRQTFAPGSELTPEKKQSLEQIHNTLQKLKPKIDNFVKHQNESFKQDKALAIKKESERIKNMSSEDWKKESEAKGYGKGKYQGD